MHAETVLKLTMQDTLQQAAQNRDAWIRAYREIVSEHPAAEDLAEQLIDSGAAKNKLEEFIAKSNEE